MWALLTQFRGRRPLVVRSAAALSLALVAFAGWSWQQTTHRATFSRDRVPRLASEVMEVAPGLYMIGSMSPSAVYVIDTSEGLILVDSGLDSDAGFLKTEMAKLELDWKRVRAILISHAHGDHTGGAQRFVRRPERGYTRAKATFQFSPREARARRSSAHSTCPSMRRTGPLSMSLSKEARRSRLVRHASRRSPVPVTRRGACAI